MAAKAHEISLEAGSKMAAAMKDVVGAAAGLTGLVVESARDLLQYMVRRGQMTQDEADKLMREVEASHVKKKPLTPPASASKTTKVEPSHPVSRAVSHSASHPVSHAPSHSTSHATPVRHAAAPAKHAAKPAAKHAAAKHAAAKKPAAKKTTMKPAAKKHPVKASAKPKSKASGKTAKRK